jgi:hypothetical protein
MCRTLFNVVQACVFNVAAWMVHDQGNALTVTRPTRAAPHGGLNGPARAQGEAPGAPAPRPKRGRAPGRSGAATATTVVIAVTRQVPSPQQQSKTWAKVPHWAQSRPDMNCSIMYCSTTAALG